MVCEPMFSMKEVHLLPLSFSVTKGVKKSYLLTPGNCESCFPIRYDPDRDIRHMTNKRLLRPRNNPPPQAAEGSGSK